jgi:hypothetical protein
MEYLLMNEIKNNISFGANIVTKMKGRNQIVSKISEEFSKRTPELKGSLHINRGGKDFENSLMFELGKKNSPTYFMCDYTNSLLGKKPEEVTPNFIDNVVTQFIKIYKLLKEESLLQDTVSPINANIEQTKNALSKNLRVSKTLKENGNKSLANIYKTLADYNKGRIQTLSHKKLEHKNQFIKKCYEICGSDKDLESYITVLNEII